MDFTRHEPEVPHHTRPESQPAAVNHEVAAVPHNEKNHKKISSWTRIGFVTLLFATTLLVVAIAGLIAFTNTNQTKYIDKSKFQAVFINDGSSNGQSVYFGHITNLTNSYMTLQDIYYITTSASSSTSSTAANSNYTLTKLGCQQLHDPYDEMIINTGQVAFWENLQNSGKVVSAITQYQKDNPNGPNCSQSQSSSSSVNTSSPQNGSSTQTP